jgi:TRAP-type mannitol/chloroaromatic compound transport system permease large subunit
VISWVLINPKVAPPLPPEQQKVPVRPWVAAVAATYSPRMLPALASAMLAPGRLMRVADERARVGRGQLVKSFLMALVPLLMAVVMLGVTWWYVVVHSQKTSNPVEVSAPASRAAPGVAGAPGVQAPGASGGLQEPQGTGLAEPAATVGQPDASSDAVAEPPGAESEKEPGNTPAQVEGSGPLEQLGDPSAEEKPPGVPEGFYTGFAVSCAAALLLLLWYYRRFNAEQHEILGMLVSSVMPLALLTFLVLAVILFGITTATESAAVGAAGAFLMAWQAGTLDWLKIKQAVFLTAKTTSMVCWLFVGSALFSAVFALLGGQRLVEEWVMSMDLTSVQFLILSQAIIFVLGWPLEWTEIIVIFIPIFLPLLAHFQIDPILFGVLVFVNLQAAFLSPPVAMSAFYLKGVSPPHVTINQIFAGMMPYMGIVILCMVLMYIWPGLTLWLPRFLYGG